MASIILTNWTVYYADDAGSDNTGYKQIRWTGGGGPESNTNSVNELYSALMDLFSVPSQNDAHDTTPMRAITPTLYEIGAFDAGDQEPWFIDPISVQHLTGGGLDTNNWTRETNEVAGIVKVPYTTGTQFVDNDIGRTVTNGTSNSSGTLLYYDSSSNEAWIRPTDNTSTHDWGGSVGTITVTGGTGSVTQSGPGVSGERVWSNIYSIGTIASYTQLYVTQSFTNFSPWWGLGHIDRLFLTNDGFDTGLIDYGLLTIFARQYTKLYDHFSADLSGGGRSPVPLATSTDTNNNSGYWTLTKSGGSGTFNVGNYIYYDNGGTYTWATSPKKGIITAVSGNDITYALLDDLTANFTSGNDLTEWTGSANDANADSVTAPVAAGPSTGNPAAITVTFGYTSQDIGDGAGPQPYSVTIDMQGNTSIAEMYNRVKYLTRRGQTSDIDDGSQSVVGEQYLAVGDIYLAYTGQTGGEFTEGATVTSATGSGVITADEPNGTAGNLMIRNVRGTFSNTQSITDGTSTATISGDPESITPSKTSPFGTKAGDNFFGARGVWIANPGAYANNYQLVDNNDETRIPPETVSITVTNTVAGDRVSVFRAQDGDTDGNINKTYLTSDNTANVAGDTEFIVNESIPADTPTSGVLRVVDEPGQSDHRFRYTSWSGSTFTFVTTGIPSGTIDAVGDVTGRSFYATDANLANVKSGDIVRNTSDGTPGSWAHVIDVTNVSGNQYFITHTPLRQGTENDWDVGDGYAFNNLPVDYDNSDTAYVPYIDQTATGTSVSVSVQYVSDRNITTRVRVKGIQPYNNHAGTLTSSGYSTSVSRIPDTIAT